MAAGNFAAGVVDSFAAEVLGSFVGVGNFAEEVGCSVAGKVVLGLDVASLREVVFGMGSDFAVEGLQMGALGSSGWVVAAGQ